jgi:hypothetical protein
VALRVSRRGWAIAACAFAALALAAAPARAADLSVQGEAMHVARDVGTAQSDSKALGGATLRLFDRGLARRDVTTRRSTVHLFVRARGQGCFGPPTISVSLGGVPRWSAVLRAGSYTYLGGPVSLPAGRHRLSVGMTSDPFLGPFCSRQAWIDSITLVAEPFRAHGWRNAPLGRHAPLAKHSKAMIADLRRQIASRPRGAGVGTAQYSSPVYVVPPDQPAVRVNGPPGRADLQAQWARVPLPAAARPAPGTDSNLVVWQPSTDTLWEFWGLRRDAVGAWHARYGGRMPFVSRNDGEFEYPPGPQFGASATSIALLAGLQRAAELQRGAIDHAVDMAILARAGRDGWCWPAHRTDPEQRRRDSSAIPAGQRFRLPAGFDLERYARDPRHPLSRYALTLARAVQRHGLIVRESSAEVGFYAEDPAPLGHDPYPAIFQGQSPDSRGALRNFPWERLQALAPPSGKLCLNDPDIDR